MRIALVAESFFPAVDGSTTTVKAVADRLIETGHTVLVMAPGPGLSSYRGARVARVQTRDRVGSQAREVLGSFRPDLVHVTTPGSLGRKALKHAQRLGLPTLVSQQSPVSPVTADHWRATVAARADRVVVTAPWLREHLADVGTYPVLWTPGVDTDAFAPQLRDAWLHRSWSRSPSGPQVVVGYVGALRKRHGVRALAQLAGVPGIRPVVVGDGAQRGWLEARLPQARFTGPLATGDLSRAIASFDVLVHPGTDETCCHSLREASASGVPVVAPRAGGARDVVRPLETGLLYDPTGRTSLAEAVASVAADRHRHLLGDRGRELALGRSWRDAVDELVAEHYSALVGDSGRTLGAA